MLFFPYRFDFDLKGIPFVTFLLALICVFVFYRQLANEQELVQAAETFCGKKQETIFNVVLSKMALPPGEQGCLRAMTRIHLSHNPADTIDEMVASARHMEGLSSSESARYMAGILRSKHEAFAAQAPEYLTKEMLYAPEDWRPTKMITAALAHGSLAHLIGNLLFFLVFGTAVEIMLGSLAYLLLITSLALGTHVIYSLATLSMVDAASTLGLSGVIMGIIALAAFLLPRARVLCFFWLVVIFKRFSVQAWLLALGYIGLDAYSLFIANEHSTTNLIAHVAGAALGLVYGLLFFRETRREMALVNVGT